MLLHLVSFTEHDYIELIRTATCNCPPALMTAEYSLHQAHHGLMPLTGISVAGFGAFINVFCDSTCVSPSKYINVLCIPN